MNLQKKKFLRDFIVSIVEKRQEFNITTTTLISTLLLVFIEKIFQSFVSFLTTLFKIISTYNLSTCKYLTATTATNQKFTLYHGHKTTIFDSYTKSNINDVVILPQVLSTSLSLSVACRFTKEYNVILFIQIPEAKKIYTIIFL